MIGHRQGTFKSANLELYFQHWYPQNHAKAILAIVPGIGGHCGLYEHIIQTLVPHNYAIFSFDLRGNGRSEGQRGYINRWQEFRDDLDTFLQWILTQAPHCPIFLLGQSLGGLIVLDYVLRNPAVTTQIQGVIALSPALGQVGVSPFKMALGQVLSRLYPRFRLHSGIPLSAASRDPIALAADAQDPLRHDWVTARLATEFLATIEHVQSHADQWTCPLLILHGEADRVTLPEGSRQFFDAIPFSDKEKKEYPGAYHELQNDLNYSTVIADLEDWLERHL
ncbi:MAG: lysophospholipase [Alkalinema sp. CACIAM 70d]|nr:MAG: lysophospholipase [Alkalinema sp. CACIAM 70d]